VVGNRKNSRPELMDQVGLLWEFTPTSLASCCWSSFGVGREQHN
jgi:hypothetical protein